MEDDDMRRTLVALLPFLLASAPAAAFDKDGAALPVALYGASAPLILMSKGVIVCNTEAQARSFLAFVATPGAAGRLKGNGPASDGRLCSVRLLDGVEIGSVVATMEADGYHCAG